MLLLAQMQLLCAMCLIILLQLEFLAELFLRKVLSMM